jgi:hypothetical protein
MCETERAEEPCEVEVDGKTDIDCGKEQRTTNERSIYSRGGVGAYALARASEGSSMAPSEVHQHRATRCDVENGSNRRNGKRDEW